jgi:hypothetical protein
VSGGVRGLASSLRAAGSASGWVLSAHDLAPALELVVLAQPLERGHDLVQISSGGLGQGLGRQGIRAEEQQRLQGPLELGGHEIAAVPVMRPASGAIRLMVISANGCSWVQVASPCL